MEKSLSICIGKERCNNPVSHFMPQSQCHIFAMLLCPDFSHMLTTLLSHHGPAVKIEVRLWRGHAYIFPIVKNVPIDVSAHARQNVKSSMCSEMTKDFRYKCHGLFVNSPMMITLKSFLKCRSMQ